MREYIVEPSETCSSRNLLRPVFIAVFAAKIVVAGLLIANLNLAPHALAETKVAVPAVE